MCGIAGCLSPLAPEALKPIAAAMTHVLRHRGPDAGGAVAESVGERSIGLAHRRLAIVDLSERGAQPMESASKRYLLSFNGEIYNHLSLREELKKLGAHFRGGSDTETMLAAFEAWGLEESLRRFSGMFAFALWDRNARALTLARDRLGEKPLYYGTAGASFLFASELKALREHPHFEARVRRESLELMLEYGYVPAPFAIYQNTFKLPPAHYLTIAANGSFGKPKPYWDLMSAAKRGLANPLAPEEIDAELERCLAEVIREQLVADVPVGTFLSGGIDSSLISALAARAHPQKLRTFSIGFETSGYDESAYARKVADHIGSEHTELFVRGKDALRAVPELPAVYDEPFGDASALPTLLLARLTREHVTVALSGDGGDEAFAGYNRYVHAMRLWRLAKPIPWALRAGVSKLAKIAGTERLGRFLQVPQPEEKIRKTLALLESGSLRDVYWRLMSQGLGAGAAYAPAEIGDAWDLEGIAPLQLLDQRMYLPDDILVKVDRASMAASLETRAPLLDHRVVELAWRIPLDQRVKEEQGKLPLRRLLAKYLPAHCMDRPKSGFTPPVGAWLRGPLKNWAEDLLSQEALADLPGADAIHAAWKRHLTDPASNGIRLWPALMAQAWLRRSPQSSCGLASPKNIS